MKFTASFGMPASKRMSINFAAIVGESLAGLSTTVLPVTSEAAVIPAMMAHGVCCAEEALRALLWRNFFPRVKVFVGVFDRLPRHLRRRILENSNNFHRMRRVRGGALFRGGHLLPVEPHRVFTAEFAFHLFQRLLHARAVFRLGKINKRFVMELRNVDNLFRSSHGGCLLGVKIYSSAPAKYPRTQDRRWSWHASHSFADDSRTAHLRR